MNFENDEVDEDPIDMEVPDERKGITDPEEC